MDAEFGEDVDLFEGKKRQRCEISQPPPRRLSVYQDLGQASPDEVYSDHEVALNAFLKTHPLSSSLATQPETLRLLSSASVEPLVTLNDIEVCTRCHDEAFLCAPNQAAGERECANEASCIAKFIALVRHGSNSAESRVVLKEFLTPSELKSFQKTGALPGARQPCLLCMRYMVSYIYFLARTTPEYSVSAHSATASLFTNAAKFDFKQLTEKAKKSLVEKTTHEASEAASDLSSVRDRLANGDFRFCNDVETSTGYPKSALLAVDEHVLNLPTRSVIGSLLFQPVVRFNSTDYSFSVVGERVDVYQDFHNPSSNLLDSAGVSEDPEKKKKKKKKKKKTSQHEEIDHGESREFCEVDDPMPTAT